MKFKTSCKTEKSFTLIELLVVIAIIGILSGIVLTAFGRVRATARDAVRKQELRQIYIALEMYYITHNNYPPVPFVAYGASTPYDTSKGDGYDAQEDFWSPNSALMALVDEGIAPALPVDPVNKYFSEADNFSYLYYPVCCDATGSLGATTGIRIVTGHLFQAECGPDEVKCTGYILATNLENDNDPARVDIVNGDLHCGCFYEWWYWNDYCLYGGVKEKGPERPFECNNLGHI